MDNIIDALSIVCTRHLSGGEALSACKILALA